jgi:penicillin-binding protein 2A
MVYQDQLGQRLQIYTQMDPLFNKLLRVYHDDRFSLPVSLIRSAKRIVIIDQHNGGIRGLVGYRGESLFREFNHPPT